MQWGSIFLVSYGARRSESQGRRKGRLLRSAAIMGASQIRVDKLSTALLENWQRL
jgi:hypothetical protein